MANEDWMTEAKALNKRMSEKKQGQGTSEVDKIKAIPLYGQKPVQVVIAMSSDWLAGPYCEDAAVEYATLRAQLASMTAERDALKAALQAVEVNCSIPWSADMDCVCENCQDNLEIIHDAWKEVSHA